LIDASTRISLPSSSSSQGSRSAPAAAIARVTARRLLPGAIGELDRFALHPDR
jgi:hypothetical protein